jgi:hypothetical protein
VSAKTMGEVLAAHRLDVTMYLGTGQEHLCICGNRSDNHDAHQEVQLIAAGFGYVRGAAADFNTKVQELAKRLLDEDITDSLDVLDKLATGELKLT